MHNHKVFLLGCANLNTHVCMYLHYVLFSHNLFLTYMFGETRILAGEKCPRCLSPEPHQAEEKIPQETVICHSKPPSLSSTESSEGGKFFMCLFFEDFTENFDSSQTRNNVEYDMRDSPPLLSIYCKGL